MDEKAVKNHEGHEDYHAARIMYVIKSDEVIVGPRGTIMSHMEWFEKEGWMTADNAREFMESHTRGFFLPSANIFHSYRGIGFFFDDEVIEEVKGFLPRLREVLGLKDDTRVMFGPKDAVFGGVNHEKRYLGTVSELTQ